LSYAPVQSLGGTIFIRFAVDVKGRESDDAHRRTWMN
jgi:hypothetical protein